MAALEASISKSGRKGSVAALVPAGHQEGRRVRHHHQAQGPGQEGQLRG